MNDTFFIADPHFGHKGILLKENNPRPFKTVEEMDLHLINEWQNTVSSTDTVYVCGDFSFHKKDKTRDIFFQLPGKKILIQGNHDGDQTRAMFRPFVFQEVTLKLFGERVKLSHYPYQGDHTEEDRYPDRRPKDHGEWLIHGHVHNLWKQRDKMICVSVENWHYRPVSLDEIQKIINRN